MISKRVPDFSDVIGIPKGGIEIAFALNKYKNKESNRLLIVDDVFTTGNSMEEMREKYSHIYAKPAIIGSVIFARSKTPDWITPLFQLTPEK